MGLVREQCAEWKKAPLQYCCNQVWMRIGGQILWNAIPICETAQISCLMGKLQTRDVLGNHLKDLLFHLVHWLSITLSLRKTSQESINLERKSYLDCLIRFVRGWNLEGWHNGCRHWGVGNDGRIRNLPRKTRCERGDISQRKWKIHISSRRWTNQICWRRSGTENIHLDTGTPNSRRNSQIFSWRIRRVSSSSRLISVYRWSDKWLLLHVRKLHIPPSRWTQSQTLLAERRIIPYSTEIHWRLQNYTHELGCYARTTHRWLLEIDGSRNLSDSWTGYTQFTLLEEKPPDGF